MNFPTDCLNDSVNSCQPKTSSGTHLLGGEKRLEDSALHLISHPHSGIRDGKSDKVPDRSYWFEGLRWRGSHGFGYPRGGQDQVAPSRHGIPGIYRQIHHDLMEQSRLAANRWKVGV